jgi:hypothetical protein
MIDQRTRTLTVEDCEEIAARFAAAAGSYRYRPRLQTALMLGSRLIVTLIRRGIITGSINLEGECHGC